MKEGWIVKKLGEIFETQSGGTPLKTHKEYYEEGNIPWLRSGEVCKKYIQDTEMYITSLGLENSSAKYFPIDTVVVAMYGATAGQVGILKLETTTNQAICGIFPREDYIPEFLYYVLHSKYYELVSQAIGNAQPNISQNKIRNLYIPIVDYPEQHRIVSELDCLNGIIDKKREQLKELDALAQSIFYDMFGDPIMNEKGWERIQINDCVIEMFIGPFGSSLKKECYVNKEDAYCMVYEQKHAINKRFDLENHYIDKDKYIELKRFEVGPSDFIMSCRGTIGEIYQIPSTAPKGIIHPSLMKIRLNDKVCNPIFFEKILAIIVKGQDMKGGCIKMAITAKSLGKILIIIPPMELQNLYAEKISAIDKQKELIKQSLAEVEYLFNSRMDYYFH